jgi:hypothetical protein
MIQYVVLGLITFMFATLLRAQEMSEDDFKIGQKYGYLRHDLRAAYAEKKREVNRDQVIKSVSYNLENDQIKAAKQYDEAISNLLRKADVILRAEGHDDVADEIQTEYMLYYQNAATNYVLGTVEIGDHPPLSEWIDKVHDKIHKTLSDFICKNMHFHDLYILNHGLPVVFSPKKYTLKDYLDHFSGHLVWGWFWDHHGVAGVVTYWLVDGVCIAGTYGLGIVTFVCGPVATLAENVMDKSIAPPIGKRIWERAQQGK